MNQAIDNSKVMRCVAYQKGVGIGDVTIEDISEVLLKEDTFVWLGLREADSGILRAIQIEFGLHDLAIEDACSAHQRPKIEEYGDSLFIVLQTAQLVDDSVAFGETHLFVGPRFLVTVRHGASHSLARVRERCQAMPQLLAKGSGFALYSVMDFIVDNYMPVINGLQERFDVLESAIFQNRPSRQTMEGLYELKRELLLLEGAINPVIDICNELMRFHGGMIHKDVRFYFRDVADHIKRVDRAIQGMREMLLAAMQVHLTFETVRQNEVVKRLAGWGAILAIPTMVFSWYGMNFRHMPELEWAFSYPLVLAGVAVGSLGLYWRLKRSGWL
ncbi:magnesium and cobalt transport protein CorA [Methylomonas sp. SURF-1]|uniref:Magnesium and cobalt transport protein CorA n=2 Tax=Methylomonas aurea TaxID=2952224 RepID=A0ABT1UFQ5_9GAMM|nr:magnesium and cobalt transport protein CorA [Methylomonas sp. SURF-1]MCQ8181064.1 magnesium and cobalt transport protein CorA [Methylomonas sp. SURF-1]